MNSTERKIFSQLGALKTDYASKTGMHHLLSSGVDLERLIQTALREGIAGLLYKYLLNAGLIDSLSLKHRKQLEAIYYRILYSNIKLTHSLKPALHRFNEENIHVVLLQGIALIQQVYVDLGLRPLTDIDFWVLPDDYPALSSILIHEGYERDPLYPNTFRKGATTLDIHTHILWADRIPARKLLIKKSEEDIYRETERLQIDGESARCLNPYDQVIYLSLHALKHYMNRLIWLVDIKSLLIRWKESDWVGLINRAKELGQERALSYVFFLLERLLDHHPPSNIKRLLHGRKLNLFEKKILAERIKGQSLPLWAPVFLFSSGMPLRKRLQFICQSTFPSPDTLRQVFANSPDLKVWELYGRRILQALGRK